MRTIGGMIWIGLTLGSVVGCEDERAAACKDVPMSQNLSAADCRKLKELTSADRGRRDLMTYQHMVPPDSRPAEER